MTAAGLGSFTFVEGGNPLGTVGLGALSIAIGPDASPFDTGGAADDVAAGLD